MKQKMVIKVCAPACEKSCRRSKAMELAARTKGVSSTAIAGDQLEVVGEDVDIVCLVICLRKKVGPTDILRVEEIKEKKDKEEDKGKGKGNKDGTERKDPTPQLPLPRYPSYCSYYYPPPSTVFYDEPAGTCIIL